jgi:PAS domain S-box-containing protein
MSLVLEPEVEAGFLELINNNPDIISKISRDLVLVYLNDTACKLSNHPRAYFVGKSVRSIIGNGEKQDKIIEAIQQVFRSGIAVSYQSEGFSNTDKFYQFEVIPLEYQNGQLLHVMTILKDISVSKQTEIKLKKNIHELEVLSDHLVYQNKLLQEFSYITSHNLRSPMSNLKILLQLYEETKEQQEREFLFGKLKVLAENLSNSVNDLTGTVSMKGKLVKELEDIFFEKQLTETIEALYADIEESNANISFDFNEVPSIYFPKLYLESIFLNLMTNSIKYRSANRELKISVKTRVIEDYTELTWSDNGLGLNMAEHGHLLFGLKNTFHHRKDSRGIGLFITKNQIESVGGSIRAESEEGKGCTFIILFKNIKKL